MAKTGKDGRPWLWTGRSYRFSRRVIGARWIFLRLTGPRIVLGQAQMTWVSPLGGVQGAASIGKQRLRCYAEDPLACAPASGFADLEGSERVGLRYVTLKVWFV